MKPRYRVLVIQEATLISGASNVLTSRLDVKMLLGNLGVSGSQVKQLFFFYYLLANLIFQHLKSQVLMKSPFFPTQLNISSTDCKSQLVRKARFILVFLSHDLLVLLIIYHFILYMLSVKENMFSHVSEVG